MPCAMPTYDSRFKTHSSSLQARLPGIQQSFRQIIFYIFQRTCSPEHLSVVHFSTFPQRQQKCRWRKRHNNGNKKKKIVSYQVRTTNIPGTYYTWYDKSSSTGPPKKKTSSKKCSLRFTAKHKNSGVEILHVLECNHSQIKNRTFQPLVSCTLHTRYCNTSYNNCQQATTDYTPFAPASLLTCEANVLVFYSLHVEPDGGNSRHHLPELELVQDSGFTGRVQTHLCTASHQ